MEKEALIDKLVSFVESIGIDVTFGKVPEEKEFLPGICINHASLLIDKDGIKYPGDILHEAGHLAVAPPSKRKTMDGKLGGDNKQHDGAEEMMTIAWTYAASLHLGIDPQIVFHEDGYKSEGANIIDDFSNGRFFGVSLLQWTGLSYEPKRAKELGIEPFPKMVKWIREHEPA